MRPPPLTRSRPELKFSQLPSYAAGYAVTARSMSPTGQGTAALRRDLPPVPYRLRRHAAALRPVISDRPIVAAAQAEWPGLTLLVQHKTGGDIDVPSAPLNMLVTTLDPTPRNLLTIDGTGTAGPTPPAATAQVPMGAAFRAVWQNFQPVQPWQVALFGADLLQAHAPELASPAVMRGHLVPGSFEQRPQVSVLLDRLAAELDPARRRGRLFAESVIRLLVLEILAGCWSNRVTRFDPVPRCDPRVAQAIDFIDAHFAEDISLTEIAAAAALSPSQLGALFRGATGKSPYAYVIDRRLDMAARLLQSTTRPVAQIALDCGFADQSHLTRACRSRLGTTPGALRRQR